MFEDDGQGGQRFPHLSEAILSHLSEFDLCRLCQVSRGFNKLVRDRFDLNIIYLSHQLKTFDCMTALEENMLRRIIDSGQDAIVEKLGNFCFHNFQNSEFQS